MWLKLVSINSQSEQQLVAVSGWVLFLIDTRGNVDQSPLVVVREAPSSLSPPLCFFC